MFDPWVGKIPLEEGMATYSMEYSFLKNPIDRGAWQATARGVTMSRTGLKRLSTHTYMTLSGVRHTQTQDAGHSFRGYGE